MQLIKHGCAHHTRIWTSLWQKALNTHSPWTFYAEILGETKSSCVFSRLVLGSAWLKWEVISMTHPEFSLNSASANFYCSRIKWRGSSFSNYSKYLLGLHQARSALSRECLALQPEKRRGSWGSAAQNIHVDGSQMCQLPFVSFHLTQVPTPFLKPHPDISGSV